MDLTLFELHVEDASLSAGTPFGGREEETESGGGAGRLVAVLAAVAITAVALYLVRNGAPESVPARGDVKARQ